MDAINAILNFLNGIIWSDFYVYLLLFSGLFFSIRTKFCQVRLIKPMIQLLFKGEKSEKGISSFQALCTALAGRVGTGNIAGTATAIFYGGPGALFWMWMSAFLGAASAYLEAALSQTYKVEIDGQYRGGPSYYILRGMKSRWYAMLFAVAALLACGVFLPGVQSNTIANAFYNSLGVPLIATGIVLGIVLAIIIFGGVKRVAATAELIVPFMAIIYMIMALIIVIANIDQLGSVIATVFGSAFSADATFGGLIGLAISWGVKRGVYSNEAGQGTAGPASAAAEVSHPAKQGLVQAFSVYIDTLLVCSATGFMILMTGAYNVLGAAGTGGSIAKADGATFLFEGAPELAAAGTVGPEFTQQAVSTLLPGFGGVFVAICLVFFAFTTIMAYYYQAETNIAYIFRGGDSAMRKTVTFILRLFMVAVVTIFTLTSAPTAWAAGDVGVGLMGWINIIAIWILHNRGVATLDDFEMQYKAGKDPVFNPDSVGKKGMVFKDCDIWKEINKDRI